MDDLLVIINPDKVIDRTSPARGVDWEVSYSSLFPNPEILIRPMATRSLTTKKSAGFNFQL